jgi:hypothetical protein
MSNQRPPSLRKTNGKIDAFHLHKERWLTPIEVVYTTPIRNEPNRLKFIHEVLERRVRDAVKLGLYEALGAAKHRALICESVDQSFAHRDTSTGL